MQLGVVNDETDQYKIRKCCQPRQNKKLQLAFWQPEVFYRQIYQTHAAVLEIPQYYYHTTSLIAIFIFVNGHISHTGVCIDMDYR